jgi:hypothetical protein
MNLKQQYRSIYKWQARFDDGHVVDEGGDWKGACQLRLLPYTNGYPEVWVDVPEGASPRFFFTIIEYLNGEVIDLVFHIGYTSDQGELLLNVSSFYKTVSSSWVGK